jgi:lysophospholipase L1-like esterase
LSEYTKAPPVPEFRLYEKLAYNVPTMKRLAACTLVCLLLVLAGVSSGQPTAEHWVGVWATSPIGRPPYPPLPPETAGQSAPPQPPRLAFPHDQTLREITRTTMAGTRVRVAVSNAFGTAPLVIGAAHIALRDRDATIVAASGRPLTFAGSPRVVIPAGAFLLSDAVALAVPAFADLAIDLYLPGDTTGQTLTVHRSAYQTSYLSASGNQAGATDMAGATTITSWYFLTGVEVTTAERPTVIVTLGDSITDGTGSTVDANLRWPDHLARRLTAQPGGRATIAVLNAGIGGNRLLSESIPEFGVNILARFDRDVLAQPGITHVVVMEGINDIGNARDNPLPGAADLIAAHAQLIERAHAHGLRIYGATLTPFEGAAYFTETGEAKRQALNAWIRAGTAYDGVIDFDAAVRDPQHPTRFLPAYESRDHLHPSDAGYLAMGSAIDLTLFK